MGNGRFNGDILEVVRLARTTHGPGLPASPASRYPNHQQLRNTIAMMDLLSVELRSTLTITFRKSRSLINLPQPSLSFIHQRTLARNTIFHTSITP
jgi:hypothetical protein